MCDSSSINWHCDKCFAPVLRLTSTHHLISWRWAMEPVQAAAPKAVSSNGKTMKKRTWCQASKGNNAVVTELLSTARSSVWRTAFTPTGIKKTSTQVCASLNRWHISWRRPSQTFFKCLLSEHCACVIACISQLLRRNSNNCNREVIHPVVFAIWSIV